MRQFPQNVGYRWGYRAFPRYAEKARSLQGFDNRAADELSAAMSISLTSGFEFSGVMNVSRWAQINYDSWHRRKRHGLFRLHTGHWIVE